jgi:hypothetical protein
MSEWWWLSCSRFTVGVEIKDGVIVDAAPIVRKFIGQPTRNLGRWMRGIGGFQAVRVGGAER